MAASVIRLAISNTYMNRKITWKKKNKTPRHLKKVWKPKPGFTGILSFPKPPFLPPSTQVLLPLRFSLYSEAYSTISSFSDSPPPP